MTATRSLTSVAELSNAGLIPEAKRGAAAAVAENPTRRPGLRRAIGSRRPDLGTPRHDIRGFH